MKNDALKKHHFWILLGLIPLLVLISMLMITSGVGAEIDAKQKEIEAAKSEISSKSSPKPAGLLTNLDVQIDKLRVKRTDLWKENWERSIGVYLKEEEGKEPVQVQDPSKNLLRWPKSKLLDRFNYNENYATDPAQLKFGAEIVRQEDDRGEYAEFKKPEVYIAEFSNAQKTGMADKVAPTTFRGGRWETVLRHVVTPNGWGLGRPTSEQLWLALEDIWIQRGMLGQITAVNKSIGEFKPIPRRGTDGRDLPDTKFERDFQSRIWRVSLKLALRETDNRYIFTGTLTNLTDRLQLMGIGNVMTLNVWLSKDPNAQPVKLKIYGEFVPGRGSGGRENYPIPPSEENVLPAGINPVEIARVEQEFDARTVPIRRIDRLVLGFQDSRYAQVALQMPKFPKFQGLADAATATAGPGGDLPGQPPGPLTQPGFGSPDGGPGGANSGKEGGGTATTVLDGNRKRYVVVTEQIRRMPVAITVVVDQAYIQDVLLAYANAPLRFQITQVHWQRFRDRGSLGGVGGYGSGGAEYGGMNPDEPVLSGQGYAGSGFGATGSPDGGGGLGVPPGGGGLGFPPGGGLFPPGGMGPGPGPGPGFPGAASFPMPGMPGGSPSPGSPYGPGSTTVTGSQLTAGLVEMTVYGLVSLYEKYEAKTAGEGEQATTP